MARTDRFNGENDFDIKLLLEFGFSLLALALMGLCVTICQICLERRLLSAAFRRRAQSNRLHQPASGLEHDSLRVEGLGLEKSVTEVFPVFVYRSEIHKERLECAVCLSDLQENEKAKTLPNCKHSFHVECIDTWFRSHSTCPLCRTAAQPHQPSVGDCVAIAVDGETSGTTDDQVPPDAVENQ